MNTIVNSGGMTVDISSKPNQSTQLGKAGAIDSSGCTQNKLQKFLKGNLNMLGVAQIMIGMKFIFYGTIGIIVLHFKVFTSSFFSFKTGFPIWAALSFIISGSLTIVSAKKQTKPLLRGNLGANTFSTIVSSIGFIVLSDDLIKILFTTCEREDLCSGIKSAATGLVISLMILSFLQLSITISLSMLTYNVDGKDIGWTSALPCLKSASEDPYQDFLPQTSFYQDFEQNSTISSHYDP
ncbi:membrane-spanning 4-domains subfamily A member 3-like [Choloepus didactylus]|uniref:membrane-spanning 4-domains subfamily A member 3-like n=1 Tax=Choloepus didactylus TaxID=27675 RepID=UPI00189F88BF|nr:membrane-spanning 4-domains subfamily A member 3-like [Choloepus didactylus]